MNPKPHSPLLLGSWVIAKTWHPPWEIMSSIPSLAFKCNTLSPKLASHSNGKISMLSISPLCESLFFFFALPTCFNFTLLQSSTLQWCNPHISLNPEKNESARIMRIWFLQICWSWLYDTFSKFTQKKKRNNNNNRNSPKIAEVQKDKVENRKLLLLINCWQNFLELQQQNMFLPSCRFIHLHKATKWKEGSWIV